MMSSHEKIKYIVSISLLFLLGGLYLFKALDIANNRNSNVAAGDQSVYLLYGARLRGSDYHYVGPRNQTPLYPVLISRLFPADIKPNDVEAILNNHVFNLGKRVNIIVSIVCLLLIAFVLRRQLDGIGWIAIFLTVAFTVYVSKAGFVQVELLFYTLNFFLFLLFLRLLNRPSLLWGVAAGIFAGICHLTKASITLGLALYIAFALVGVFFKLIQDKTFLRSKEMLRAIATPLLFGICFIVTVWPYINTSKKIFGSYFYNVNTTFYIWYDTNDQVYRSDISTQKHGDHFAWPNLPAEQIPSAKKYLAEHTPQQIVERFVKGSSLVIKGMVRSYGYFPLLGLFGATFLTISLLKLKKSEQLIRDHLPIVGFLLIYSTLHYLS